MAEATPADACFAMTAGGVTLLLDVSGGRLPAVVHWGAPLPDLGAAELRVLAVAGEPVAGSNNSTPVPRLSVLPEHHTGWTGRPGLRGSFVGRQWSPAFTVREVTLDGRPAEGLTACGAGVVQAVAADDSGGRGPSQPLQFGPVTFTQHQRRGRTIRHAAIVSTNQPSNN